MKEWLRLIPAVHEYQQDNRFKHIMKENQIDFAQLSIHLKKIIEDIRTSILSQQWINSPPGTEDFNDEVFNQLEKYIKASYSPTLQRVVNATGTILHTNLGRSRLSDRAMDRVIDIAKNYSNLEYKLSEGERGSRHSHIEKLITEITGAESAMVVNNNAAAVYLILRAFAQNKEVIVSRGQLVEIGGSFRVSSIMEESGAKLKEIGTTNKTHLYDYEQAISAETAMIMKVHTSNFKIMGFTKTVDSQELIQLSNRQNNILFYEDLGSGALYDFRRFGIGEEPIVKEIIELGADLVSFSGDKLLGGPQAGIIAGKKTLIDKLKKHQLARVVRVDKMTLAALEGTLIDYVSGENGIKNIPTIRELFISKSELLGRSHNFIQELSDLSEHYSVKLVDGTSQVGGGTMPEVTLPTVLISFSHDLYTAEQLSKKL
ncbi:MAG: L-seryl-tRNA(Sec) selenium transferase, partial [Bacillota bacterium]|nr:L-seryl-tRNA(Sec) selenium transferase [Bacillota bacterium]